MSKLFGSRDSPLIAESLIPLSTKRGLIPNNAASNCMRPSFRISHNSSHCFLTCLILVPKLLGVTGLAIENGCGGATGDPSNSWGCTISARIWPFGIAFSPMFH